MPLNTTSFRFHINAVVTLAMLLLSAIVTAFITINASSILENTIVNDGKKIVETLANSVDVRLSLLYRSPENADITTDSTLKFPHVINVSVYDSEGIAIIQKGETPHSADHIRHVAKSRRGEVLVEDSLHKWHFWSPVLVDQHSPNKLGDPPKREEIGFVHVDMTKDALKDFRTELILKVTIIVLIITLMSLGLVYAVTKKITHPIRHLSNVMKNSNIEGEWQAQTPYGAFEIRIMWNAFNKMMSRLVQHEKELEEEVNIKTTDLKKARDEALKFNDENRNLIKVMNQRLEDERKMISREIHDQMNAKLLAMKLDLSRMSKMLNCQPPVEVDEVIPVVENIQNIRSEVYDISRNIIDKLHPELIVSLGFEGAVRQLIEDYNKSRGENIVTLLIAKNIELSNEISIALYRIIQECLNNITKHSQAKNAVVSIKHATIDNNEIIALTVNDDGIGFDTSGLKPNAIGIIGMRERAYSIDGSFTIISTNSGTEIIVEVPFPVVET